MVSWVELTHFLSAFRHLIAEYILDSHDMSAFPKYVLSNNIVSELTSLKFELLY